jgi:hypothetical protein
LNKTSLALGKGVKLHPIELALIERGADTDSAWDPYIGAKLMLHYEHESYDRYIDAKPMLHYKDETV